MKKILSLLLSALSFCFSVSAQQVVESDRMNGFHAVEFTGNVSVRMEAVENPSIRITLNNTDISKLEWGVTDGVLSVRLKSSIVRSDANAEVVLKYARLNRIKVSGANVQMQDTLSVPVLDIEVLSGGTLSGAFDSKDIMLKAGGNSAANVTGRTKYFTLTAAGRSKVDTRGLYCENANVSASGGAEVYVFANDRMQLSADTGGTVFYKGKPDVLRVSSHTMGDINSIGE